MALALADGVITSETSVFDFGCGKGDDVSALRSQGVQVAGWDPHHSPTVELQPSDVVNLGYVINVVEDPSERARTVESAWELTQGVLVVAARLASESRTSVVSCHADGYVTRIGTFQKLFEQGELRSWLETTLGEPALAAGPGVFYIFRDPLRRESFAASRFRSIVRRPRITRSAEVFEQHRELFEQLIDFLCRRGRPPYHDELPAVASLEEQVGSLKKALQIVRRVSDEEQWRQVEQQRSRDLLVYLALAKFGRRKKLSLLPLDMQRDIKAFFGSYTDACERADELLFSAGNLTRLRELAEASPVGKRTPSAFYVHRSALSTLAAELRVYEGCARVIVGDVEGANLIKLHLEEPKVSYLAYPCFDKDAHPALSAGLSVDLRGFRIRYREFAHAENPPVLHRKELFVTSDYPGRDRFERLTKQEESAGLLRATARIGHRLEWESSLAAANLQLRGHRLTQSNKTRPSMLGGSLEPEPEPEVDT